jgi:hypothetical protein
MHAIKKLLTLSQKDKIGRSPGPLNIRLKYKTILIGGG